MAQHDIILFKYFSQICLVGMFQTNLQIPRKGEMLLLLQCHIILKVHRRGLFCRNHVRKETKNKAILNIQMFSTKESLNDCPT